MPTRKWQGRAFTSLLSLVSFIILGVTGIMLYLAPHGRVAYWTDWHLWGLTKTQWTDIHILGALLFLIAGGFHLYFNWNPLIKYLGSKAKGAFKYQKEFWLSAAILAWLMASGMYSLPPLGYVIDLAETIKEAWVAAPQYEPPFGHAEELSLKGFSSKMGIPLDKAMAEFKAQNVKISDPRQSLKQIALDNNTTPMALYMLIQKYEPKMEKLAPSPGLTLEEIEAKFAGKGIGRRTFAQLLEQLEVDPALARKRLKAKGIEIADDEKLKEAADRAGVTPLDLMKIILLGE